MFEGFCEWFAESVYPRAASSCKSGLRPETAPRPEQARVDRSLRSLAEQPSWTDESTESATSTKRSLGLMLEYLETEGHLTSGGREQAGRLFAEPVDETHWSIELVMAAGAWIAALLGLLFVGELFRFSFQSPALTLLGAMITGGGLALRSTDAGGAFGRQLARALMMTGAMVIVATQGNHRDMLPATTAAAGLWVGFHVLCADRVTQFLATGLLIFCANLCRPVMPFALFSPVVTACAVASIGYFTLDRAPRRLAPAAYAAALALPGLVLDHGALGSPLASSVALWERMFMFVALVRTVGVARRHAGLAPHETPALAVGLALPALAASPGLLASVALLVVGHDRQDRVVTWIGGLSLPVFLFAFYHDLHVTLATKSLALIASGVVLLTGRQILVRGGR